MKERSGKLLRLLQNTLVGGLTALLVSLMVTSKQANNAILKEIREDVKEILEYIEDIKNANKSGTKGLY